MTLHQYVRIAFLLLVQESDFQKLRKKTESLLKLDIMKYYWGEEL